MSADLRLKSLIDRVLRLKAEQDTISDDIREVYAEAKGQGYDKTAMGELVAYLRKVEKKGADALAERTAVFDLYLDAYQRGGSHAHAPAHAREGLTGTPHDPETGELIETSEAAIVPPTATEQPETAPSSHVVSGAHFNPAHDLLPSQGEPATGDGALVAASPSSSEPFEPPVFLRKTMEVA